MKRTRNFYSASKFELVLPTVLYRHVSVVLEVLNFLEISVG